MHSPHAARSHPESRPAAGRCLLDSMCSMDLVPLDQLVGWRIRPEVVWCLQLCVLQSARPDYDKIQINQGGEIWVKFEQTQNQKSYLYTPIYYTTIKWIQYFMDTQCGIENLNRLTQKRCQDRAEYRVMHQGFFFIILTANTQKGQADSFHDFIQNEFIQMSIKGACTNKLHPTLSYPRYTVLFCPGPYQKGQCGPRCAWWPELREAEEVGLQRNPVCGEAPVHLCSGSFWELEMDRKKNS